MAQIKIRGVLAVIDRHPLFNIYQIEMEKQAVEAIQKWLHTNVAYLSNREGYPRGFKAGILRAKEIIAEILRQNGIEEKYPNHLL